MKAEEKKQIYNLLKTVSVAVNGYIPDTFSGKDPLFQDDENIISQNEFSTSSARTDNSEKISVSKNNNTSSVQEKPKSISISSLNQKIQSCNRCRLSGSRTNCIPGTGIDHPIVLVIADGQNSSENLQDLPFTGPQGLLLDKMLSSISLSTTTNCYITTLVKCRPQENRQPLSDEVSACISFLDAQISVLKPKMILIMGENAGQTIFRTNSPINSFRGKIISYNGVPAISTFHPDTLLQNSQLKAGAWQDLKLLRSQLEQIMPGYENSFNRV